MKQFNCILNEPYPKADVLRENKDLAEYILSLLYGKNGELTSIMQYTYQSVCLPKKYAYISDVMQCIAISEMKHYELLNKLVILLGGDIRTCIHDRGRCVYWNGAYIDHDKNPKKFLYKNIKDEKTAVSAYEDLIVRSNDPVLNNVIKRIVADEKNHMTILTDIYGKFYGR